MLGKVARTRYCASMLCTLHIAMQQLILQQPCAVPHEVALVTFVLYFSPRCIAVVCIAVCIAVEERILVSAEVFANPGLDSGLQRRRILIWWTEPLVSTFPTRKSSKCSEVCANL